MITLIKHSRRGDVYSAMPLHEVAESIMTGALATEHDIPELCFAAEWTKHKGEIRLKSHNMLCLLQVRNLASEEEVGEAFRMAQAVPYTALAFRGRDMRSISIVCRYAFAGCEREELRAGDKKADGDKLLRYLLNAYKQLHYAYSVQLHMTIDACLPTWQQTCAWAVDADVFYNAEALPFFAQDGEVDVPVFTVPANGRPNEIVLPFRNQQQALSCRFSWAYSHALENAREKATCPNEASEICLELLAEYCQKEGLDMAYAIRHTLLKAAYWDREAHVRKVYENAYANHLSQTIPFGSVEKTALLIMRVEAYLRSRYELRRNVLTGVVEYRERGSCDPRFRTLTEREINTMTIDALKMGLGSWDKDLHRYIESSGILEYDPLEDYLTHLPAWDGVDRVSQFTARIPSDTPRYDYYLHIWLRSMVAHWMGKDKMHGNALVPLLVGDQGCGKTSICNKLLPSELQMYYNDKVDFRSEGDIMSALSNYALINIDEFDSLKRSQQPVLKYLLTKNNVKFRPPYGKAIVARRRYASFIATTNLLHPLQDRTGSRRFACIRIRPGEIVDFLTPLDHKQFYAQILHEVNAGERFWLDDAETAELQLHNRQFEQRPDLSSLLRAHFEKPAPAPDPTQKSPHWHTLEEIIQQVQMHYPEVESTQSMRQRLGTILREQGYEVRRVKSGVQYEVAFK